MTQSPSMNHLLEGYDRMMERVREYLDEVQPDGSTPNLEGAIQRAVYRAVAAEELSEAEARLLGDYLARDLRDAGRHLAGGGREDLGDWLRLDLELVEARLLELFQAAADRTRLEMLAFEEDLERTSHYRTGEITGPGTLRCDHCARELRFHGPSRIPPCPVCHTTAFTRVAGEEA